KISKRYNQDILIAWRMPIPSIDIEVFVTLVYRALEDQQQASLESRNIKELFTVYMNPSFLYLLAKLIED
ncbi:hypothetical protein CEXT_543911, partial [Caerostris extrusa]